MIWNCSCNYYNYYHYYSGHLENNNGLRFLQLNYRQLQSITQQYYPVCITLIRFSNTIYHYYDFYRVFSGRRVK